MTAPAAARGAEPSRSSPQPPSSGQPQPGGAAAAGLPADATAAVAAQPATAASQAGAGASAISNPDAAAGGPPPAASAPAKGSASGKSCSSAAAAAQQRHASLAAAAARRAAETGAAPAAAPSGKGGPNGAHPVAPRPASGNAAVGDGAHPAVQPAANHAASHAAACGGKKGRTGPPLTAEEAERRAKRRRRHEAEVARQRHLELRRRVADITAEYEAVQNEVNHIRALWAEPPPPLEDPLTEADRAQLAVSAARRVAEVMQRGCGAALKSVMSHKWSYPFNEPVDTVRYDNYLNYVKRPIDFGTIKRNLEAGAYKEPEAMLVDVRQVFTNAFLFNPPESNVAVMAKFLQDKFEDRWQQTVTNKLLDAAASTKAEETAAIRAANEAAQAARTEGLMARAELLTNALDELGHRLADAQSLAASQCEPVSLQEKDELARGIGALSQDAFGAAMGLLVGRAPELHPGSCDMIVDMDRLDALTLRQLQSIGVFAVQHFVAVARAAGAVEEPSGSIGASDSGGPSGRGGGGGGDGDGKATPEPVVWPGLLAGSGLRGYRIPHFRGGAAPEQASGEPSQPPAPVEAQPPASAEAQPDAGVPNACAAQAGDAPAAAQQPPGQQEIQVQQQPQLQEQRPPQQQAAAQPSQQPPQQSPPGQQHRTAGQPQPANADAVQAGLQQQPPQQGGQVAAVAPQQQLMPQHQQEPQAAAQPAQQQQQYSQPPVAPATAAAMAQEATLQQSPSAASAGNAMALDRLLSTRQSGALSSSEPGDAARQAADLGAAMLHDDTHEDADAGFGGARDLQHQDSSAAPNELPQPMLLPHLQQPAQLQPPQPRQQVPQQQAPAAAAASDQETLRLGADIGVTAIERRPAPQLAALPTLRPPMVAVSAALGPDYVPQFGSHSPRAAALLPSQQQPRTLQDALRDRGADLLQGGPDVLQGGSLAACAAEAMQE